CSWCGGPFNSGNYRHCTNVSFGDEPVYDSNPNSYNQTPDFSNPLPHHNYETDSRSDTGAAFQAEFAKLQQNFERFMAQQSCSYCGGPFNGGNYPSRSIVGAENEFFHDPNPFPYDNTPDFYDQPPQHHVETYSCELCGNDSHYGYDCPPRFPLVYEQEPCYNQNFGDNYYPQNSPSYPQYLCCENCGGPHANFQCQPRNQNFYEPNLCYNSNSSGFDQPPQYSIDHQPQEDLNQQRMNDDEWINDVMIESRNELFKTMQSLFGMFREQVANLSTHTPEPSRRFNFIYNDDEEITIPLNEIISQIPPSIEITLVLPTMEPEDSLIMGDENLSTIPEKESDKVIKSSVGDFVLSPSKSEDTSESDSECDLPSCDDFSSIDVPRGNSMTFSNPLFDANDDFTSSDDKSLPEEDDIENKDSYVSNLDEPVLLVKHLSDANEDECFNPRGDIDDINAFIDIDVSTNVEDGYHDSEGDIIYLESLIIKDTTHNLPPEVFLDHDPRSLKDEPNNDELEALW
ncbi:hypothetical protein Tco_0514435, partial [Tanacetum coccineum]